MFLRIGATVYEIKARVCHEEWNNGKDQVAEIRALAWTPNFPITSGNSFATCRVLVFPFHPRSSENFDVSLPRAIDADRKVLNTRMACRPSALM